MASGHHRRDYVQPDPHDPTLLRHQRVHRSEAVWFETVQQPVLQCRRAGRVLHADRIHPRIVPYLQMSGFYGVSRLGFFALDWHLITAIVERWRSETHTFMMSVR